MLSIRLRSWLGQFKLCPDDRREPGTASSREILSQIRNSVPRARNERVDEVLAERIWQLLERFPAFGIRSVWSWLYFREKLVVNHKKVERLMQIKGWTLKARRAGRRPRVQVTRSIAQHPDERWATDLAMVQCGEDGWCHFVPVIDCCTREILGWELDPSARAKTAERGLETALLARFDGSTALPPDSPCVMTMASSSVRASIAALFANMACSRNTSRPTRPKRTDCASASFAPSKSNVCGCIASATSNKPTASSRHGSNTTMPNGPTRPSDTSLLNNNISNAPNQHNELSN